MARLILLTSATLQSVEMLLVKKLIKSAWFDSSLPGIVSDSVSEFAYYRLRGQNGTGKPPGHEPDSVYHPVYWRSPVHRNLMRSESARPLFAVSVSQIRLKNRAIHNVDIAISIEIAHAVEAIAGTRLRIEFFQIDLIDVSVTVEVA